MDTNRLPKQALQYKPKGRRNIGRPRKRWRDQLHLEDQGTGNTLTLQEHDDDDEVRKRGKCRLNQSIIVNDLGQRAQSIYTSYANG